MERATYKKGGTAGIEGVKFQANILTVFLLNALKKLGNNWKLSTENEGLGVYNKFDDAVLELNDTTATLLQAKHKEKKKKIAITLNQLLSTNSRQDDFSLPKYFFSYLSTKAKFQRQTVIICTNAGIDKGVEDYLIHHSVRSDNMLHYQDGGCCYYTLNERILPDLMTHAETYFQKNLQGKGFEESSITESNLREFLENLQFYSNYPEGTEIIKYLLDSLKGRDRLFSDASPQDVYSKVEEWFRQPKGEYLTENYAKALFCEINSDGYFKTLENHNMVFEHDRFRNIKPKRLTHVVVESEYLLHAIKTRQVLKCGHKMLCVRPKDDTEMQNEVARAFAMPRYRSLIIIWRKITAPQEMCAQLKQILEKDKEKKVVIVANSSFKFGKEMESLEPDVINECVTLHCLSEATRKELSKRELIIFQGEALSLEELLETHTGYEGEVGAETLAKLLRGERITVGSELEHLDEEESRYYIDRVFKRYVRTEKEGLRELRKRQETVSERDICDLNEKIVAIMDIAGMGKSTVLTKLAGHTKEKNPLLWVIKVELSRYTRVLKDKLAKRGKTIDVLDLLNSESRTRLTNQLENVVFSLNGKVVLLLDGMDEISPDYTDLIVNLLEQCRKAPNFAKLYVTGRSHMAGLLETRFQMKSFALEPLTEKSRMDFLIEYWLRNLELDDTHKERCKQYGEELINRMSFWIRDCKEETEFTGVPLQIRMLGDIFATSDHSEDSSDWEGCCQYLSGNETVPKLPLEMNISTLYRMFVERKRNVFIEKVNPNGILANNQAHINQFNECLVHYRSLALEVILESSELVFFSSYQKCEENLQEYMLQIGIVQRIDGDFRFVHRTFAEYFFADAVLSELTKDPDEEFQKFFFDEILTDPKFNVIRSFLDKMLEKHVDSIPADVFQNYQSLSYELNFVESSSLMHQLAREGCVAILQLLLKCIDFKIVKDKEAKIEDIYLLLFDSPEFVSSNKLKVLQHLTQQYGVDIIDIIMSTPLHYAAENGHLGMVKFLVNQGANVNSRDDFRKTPIHYTINYFEVMQFLVEHGAYIKVKDCDGRTILEDAIFMDHLPLVIYLFGKIFPTQRINVKGDSRIPYTIAYLGIVEALDRLLRNNLNVNRALKNGETLMFAAARGGQLDTIKFLISRGANVHARDKEGNTALHVISKKGHLSVAKLLIESGMAVNVKNSAGNTPLHLGAGSLDMVKLLVENGAEVNSKNGGGETAVWLAAGRGRLEARRFLADNGAVLSYNHNTSYFSIGL